jgi:DNA-binding XRE family transcriptional regulator
MRLYWLQSCLMSVFFEGAQDYKFEDEDTFPEYAYKSIKNLASHGIIQGYPDGAFRPARLITRAEAVRMLDVVLKYIEIPEPEETIPVAPPQSPSPSPTAAPTQTPASTPEPSKTTGGGGTVRRDPKPNPTKKPASVHLTYTSSEDFNGGELIDVTSRIEDQLVLQDRSIEQSTGSIQNVYGEKSDSLYIEVTQSVAKSVLMPFGDTVEVNIDLKGAGDPLEIDRDPIDLIIAIDDSGSMEWGNEDFATENPNRLDYAKEASKGVIDLMQSVDRAAVVEFAGSVPGLETLEKMDIQSYVEKTEIKNVMIHIKSAVKSVEFMKDTDKKFGVSLGSRLKELRKKFGVSQEELAQYLNVGRTAIANYESGFTMPSVEVIDKLASYFGVSTDYLLCREIGVPDMFKK